MRAGILQEEIQILKLTHETNEFGEPFDLYTPCYKTRAEVTPLSGGRQDVNSEVFYAHTYRFIVRRYVDVNDFDRILWKDNQYRILNIDDDRQYNQKIINCELVNL
jgi:head-tail adaptor